MMTLRTTLISGLLLGTATLAYSEPCDMTIGDRTAGRDTVRILKCLNQRLDEIESRIPAGTPLQGREKGPGDVAEFDAGSFGVSVRSASRSGDKISLLLDLRNRTTETLYIAVENNTARPAILFDEINGTSDERLQASGLQLLSFQKMDKDQYSSVPPASSIGVSYRFDGQKIQSNSAKLTLELLQLEAAKPKRVTVSLRVRIRDQSR
jgi:hypothetical protein